MTVGWTKGVCCVFLIIVIGALSACGSGSGSSSSKPATITVRKGDTLYAISKRYDIPLRELIDANGLRPPYTLAVGQTLRMPRSEYHVVAKGDTFYGISRRYNMSVNTLSQLNNIGAPYTIKVGQRLRLKSGGTQVAQASSAASAASSSAAATSASSAASAAPSPAPVTTAQGQTPSSLKRSFLWPVQGKILVPYGPIAKGRHNDGINIAVPAGTTVKAAEDGTVAYAGNELQGFGNLLLIKHSGGWMTAYAHNDSLLVKKGAAVKRGQVIARSGQTGNVSSPQVHFEIRQGSSPINPMNYLERTVSSLSSEKTSG